MLFLVTFFAFLAGRQLLLPGYFESHDGIIHSMRLAHFYEALKDGGLIIRWLDTWMAGYGSPLFIFNWILPYYVGSIFHALGFNFESSLELVFLMSFILGSVFMFLFVKEITQRNISALTAGFIYTWAPYRFTDVFIRGAVGEALSFAFLPLVMYLALRIDKNASRLNFLLLSLGWLLLILTHNLIAFIFLLPYTAYIFFIKPKKKILIFSAILTGLGLSAFFWIPAVAESSLTNYSSIYGKVENQFLKPIQIINGTWRYDYAHPSSPQNSMSFELGKIHLFILVIFGFWTAFQFINGKFKFKTLSRNGFFFLAFSLFSIFMSLSYSKMFYDLVKILSLVGFPWRFLGFATFSISVIAGLLITEMKLKIGLVFTIVLIAFSIYLYLPYSKIVSWEVKIPDDEYFSMIRTNINFLPDTEFLPRDSKYMQLLEDKGPSSNKPIFETDNARAVIYNVDEKKREANINNPELLLVRANTFYFPGWQAYDGNHKINIKPDQYGLISFKLEPGEHSIKLKFEETLVRKLADIISFCTLGFLLFLLIFKKWAHEFK